MVASSVPGPSPQFCEVLGTSLSADWVRTPEALPPAQGWIPRMAPSPAPSWLVRHSYQSPVAFWTCVVTSRSSEFLVAM